jgi:acetyl-CoA synthetase
MREGEAPVKKTSRKSLRLLGTVGEPINPEAWVWYRDVIGRERTPIVDTWWQTETGGAMISAMAALTTLKPGSAQVPVPGIRIDILTDDGVRVDPPNGGLLAVTEPWPAMLRGIWGDYDRYVETYWAKFSKPEEGKWIYFAGDGAHVDVDGDIWLLGRVDDVMNVSGHRLSTTEIESVLVSNPQVAEAAVVGASDETTGQAVVAYVIVKERFRAEHTDAEFSDLLRQHVAKEIGAIARPRQVYIVTELPKTRSGKIMRRLLRDVAEGREVGDTTTLADPAVMKLIAEVSAKQ